MSENDDTICIISKSALNDWGDETLHEKDMLEGLRNKEINALHFLIEKYSRLIYKVIHSVLHNQHDKHVIDEVVNDVFMMVWENADRFDESRGHFQSGLIAIAKYKAIDYKRKNKGSCQHFKKIVRFT